MKLKSELVKLLNITFLLLIDIASFFLAILMAHYTRSLIANYCGLLPNPLFSHYLDFWWVFLILVFFMIYEDMYSTRFILWEEVKNVIAAQTGVLLFTFVISVLSKEHRDISRLMIVFFWFYGVVFLAIGRWIAKKILYDLGLWKKKVLIIGAGETGQEIARYLAREKHLGYELAAFLDDNISKKSTSISIYSQQVPLFRGIERFQEVLRKKKIPVAIIALPHFSIKKLAILTRKVQKNCENVVLVPDLKGIPFWNASLHCTFLHQVFILEIRNNLKSFYNRSIKRLFETISCLLIFPLVLPLLGFLAILIKLETPGSVFIIQRRLGKKQKEFNFIKFRSMYVNADLLLEEYLQAHPEAVEEWQKYQKLKNDPRVTKVGKFLRKTSLDELPQIFNVLRGEMSLVGPRPYLPREKSIIGDNLQDILSTTPGITGLWQVSGRNELEFAQRLELDVWYVKNWTLWLDIIILCRTVSVVLEGEGAY